MQNNIDKQEEIDIAELLRSLWRQKWFITKVTGAFLLFGLFIALFGEVKYTARSVIVPQSGKNTSGGNLQGLAAMAGINLNADQQGELLSPVVYPMVVSSVPFQKELMSLKIAVQGHNEPVTLLTYLNDSKYRGFSLFPFLKKYTLGLPGLVLKAFRGKDTLQADSLGDNIETLTADEHECLEVLSKRLWVDVDKKDGYISLSTTMPDALVASLVAARAQELLQKYVTKFKLQKVQANLDFIEARYLEVKTDFEAKQRALATFQDAHRDVVSAVALTRESRLKNEYDLAFSIYSEMARQREQASIGVKENTPVFTVIEPVTVPMKKSAPGRVAILAASLLIGLIAGTGLVFVMPWARQTFNLK